MGLRSFVDLFMIIRIGTEFFCCLFSLKTISTTICREAVFFFNSFILIQER